MADSWMLRGEFPSFPELLVRISQLEDHCNAIARSLACAVQPFRSGPIRGDRFCAFRPRRACQQLPVQQKDPLRRKESDVMEPSGLEPLTPCMP